MTPSQKEALQYLIEDASAFDPSVTIDELTYVRDRAGKISIPPPEPTGAPVTMTTLSGLRDFIGANVDQVTMGEHLLIIDDERHISLKSPRFGRHLAREIVAECVAQVPRFKFGDYMPYEEFNIALQSQFEHRGEDDDRDELLKRLARVKSGTDVIQEDDGVSQTVTVVTGIEAVREMGLPNPVQLSPWRTFAEVVQPTSPFILRANKDAGVRLALFEADGGRWRQEARSRVQRYLEQLLAEIPEDKRPHLIV